MGTSNSSHETLNRAKELAAAIGSFHINLQMDGPVASILDLFVSVIGKKPLFKVFGGTQTENLALQNIQVIHLLLSMLIIHRQDYVWSLRTCWHSFYLGLVVFRVAYWCLDQPM